MPVPTVLLYVSVSLCRSVCVRLSLVLLPLDYAPFSFWIWLFLIECIPILSFTVVFRSFFLSSFLSCIQVVLPSVFCYVLFVQFLMLDCSFFSYVFLPFRMSSFRSVFGCFLSVISLFPCLPFFCSLLFFLCFFPVFHFFLASFLSCFLCLNVFLNIPSCFLHFRLSFFLSFFLAHICLSLSVCPRVSVCVCLNA